MLGVYDPLPSWCGKVGRLRQRHAAAGGALGTGNAEMFYNRPIDSFPLIAAARRASRTT